MRNSFFKWGFTLLLLGVSTSSHAAGAILVDTDGSGQPIIWRDGIIHYNLESGAGSTLGTLTNAEASQMVRDLFVISVDLRRLGICCVKVFAEGGSVVSVRKCKD